MNTIKCPACNLVSWESEFNCKRCGYAFREEPASPPEYVTQVEAPTEQSVPTQSLDEGAPHETPQPEVYAPVPNASTNVWTPQTQPLQRKKIGLAIVSLILGIVGLPPIISFVALLVGVILGVIFGPSGTIVGICLVVLVIPAGLTSGIVSIYRANNRPNEYAGKGLAIGAVACSGISLIFVPLIAAIAIPNLLASRRAANEGLAVSTMRQLASAEQIFTRDLAPGRCGDLKTLVGVSLIDKSLEKGEKSGYRYMVANIPRGCEIHATPISTSTGNRSFFYSTEDGVIRAANKKGSFADKSDPVINDPRTPADDLPAKVALEKSR